MSKDSETQKLKDLTPEFERAVKKLLATPPMPKRASNKKPARTIKPEKE